MEMKGPLYNTLDNSIKIGVNLVWNLTQVYENIYIWTYKYINDWTLQGIGQMNFSKKSKCQMLIYTTIQYVNFIYLDYGQCFVRLL